MTDPVPLEYQIPSLSNFRPVRYSNFLNILTDTSIE